MAPVFLRKSLATGVAALVAGAGGVLVSATPALAATCGSTTVSDLNGDGFADAVIGEPGNASGSGAVHILYGGLGGLVADASGTSRDDQYFTQNSTGVPDVSEPADGFGSAVVTGDFNNDACFDLAIGVPFEDDVSGAVIVLYGSASGVTTVSAQEFTPKSLFGDATDSQEFGSALAAGDLNHDGVTDLAIGVPSRPTGDAVGAGAVAVVFGSNAGLDRGSAPDAALIHQNTVGVPGASEQLDFFGQSLAVGDFDGNEGSELAVGVPGENEGSGAIVVVHVTVGMFVTVDATALTQNSPGVPGGSEPEDTFGYALAAGDFNGDGETDLAVGAPGENGPGARFAQGKGAVTALYGSAAGLTGTGSKVFSQETAGVEGRGGAIDSFGASLAAGPLDQGPTDDLAIGAPQDAIGSVPEAGSVTLLLGGPSGLSTAGAGGSRLSQDTPGIPGSAESGDGFGAAVAVLHVVNSATGNLLIGVPAEKVGAVRAAGQVHQLATHETGPNPFGGKVFHQDTAGVLGTPGTEDQLGWSIG